MFAAESPAPSPEAAALERAIGHCFADQKLFALALTHKSHSAPHYERLEFLGDSVLGLVIAALLYQRFPDLPEGDLSRMRAHLVQESSLHRLASVCHLGQCLNLGDGEIKSGGRSRPSILADALESLLGAIYLDGGFARVFAVIERLFSGQLDAIQTATLPGQSLKDPKTRLQEWLQGRKQERPAYVLEETTGAAHAQLFHVACIITGTFALRTDGTGVSRKLAEQSAAEAALALLENPDARRKDAQTERRA
ncbi:MAG: ribonuclease III [Zoogloeaceae bacterium]|nr:ribonuclease III [Zoogloeaceae bacterium]